MSSSPSNKLWGGCKGLPCHVLMNQPKLFAICFCFAIIVDFLHCFTSKLNFTTLPFPPLLEVRPRYSVRKVLPLKFLQCDSTGWWPLAGLAPTQRVTMETFLLCLLLVWGPPPSFHGTISQIHLILMSLNISITLENAVSNSY